MSDPAAPEVVFHMFADDDQAALADRALRSLITDEAHEQKIRSLAREILHELAHAPVAAGVRRVALTEKQMKIAHTAFKLALDDTQREQSSERATLRDLLDKLPDEHTIRAISLD